jgi:glutathione S-transferase
MIRLHTFAPFLGTPDASPFVVKAMLLLKLAGLDYEERRDNPLGAPRKLLPYIEDEGEVVPDSSLIRAHIEKKYGFDFDAHLGAERKALAWAVERMCEDHLYFALLHLRWMEPGNFDKGISMLFKGLPAPARPLVKRLLIRSNGRRLHGHGLGRLSEAERVQQACRDLESLAVLLGERPYFGGEQPCGADATVFGFVTGLITPPLSSPIIDAGRRHPKLVAYRDRINARYFPGAESG